jgi:hypothetical protein
VLLAAAPALAQAAIITPSGFLFDEVPGGPGYRQSVLLGHTTKQVKRVLGRPTGVIPSFHGGSEHHYPTRTIQFTHDGRVRALRTYDRKDTIKGIRIVGAGQREIEAAGFTCNFPIQDFWTCFKRSGTGVAVIAVESGRARVVIITRVGGG